MINVLNPPDLSELSKPYQPVGFVRFIESFNGWVEFVGPGRLEGLHVESNNAVEIEIDGVNLGVDKVKTYSSDFAPSWHFKSSLRVRIDPSAGTSKDLVGLVSFE